MSNEIIDMLAPEPAKPATAIAVQPAALAGPMGMALQAMSMGMTVADLHGLLALQKDHEANEARKAYVADMAAFKLNPPEILKEKLVAIRLKDGGTGAQYMHATLGSVCEKIVESLARHGFSHRWDTKQSSGVIEVACTITHRLGHSESTSLSSGADQSGSKNSIQAMASAITYLQRYTLLAATGLATKDMDDDDGAGSEGVDGAVWDERRRVLDGWLDAVKNAQTLEEVVKIRQAGNSAYAIAKDLPAWEILKEAAQKRRAELTPAAPKS